MKRLAKLLSYAAIVGGLSLGLAYGAQWLATPIPSVKSEARVAPIPPRIAESIERKKPLPLPVLAYQEAPAMKETPAALTQLTTRQVIRELWTPKSQQHQHKKQRGLRIDARPALATPSPAAAPAPAVTTARNDTPY